MGPVSPKGRGKYARIYPNLWRGEAVEGYVGSVSPKGRGKKRKNPPTFGVGSSVGMLGGGDSLGRGVVWSFVRRRLVCRTKWCCKGIRYGEIGVCRTE